jgi:hypothetical protein
MARKNFYILNGQIGDSQYGEDSGIAIHPVSVQKTFTGESVLINTSQAIPLAKWADDNICHREVTVRYIVANEPITDPQDQLEEYIMMCMGKTDTKFYGSYSDYTGHLWTNEGFKIGGHDVIRELNSVHGKFVHMEIEVH